MTILLSEPRFSRREAGWELRAWEVGCGVGRGLAWVGVDPRQHCGAQLCAISRSCGPWRLHLPAGGGERGRGREAGFPLLLPRDGGRTVHADGCCEYSFNRWVDGALPICCLLLWAQACLSPSIFYFWPVPFPGTPETHLHPFIFQELFKKVVPYHCLGCIWSQRDKKGKEHLAPTIRATVSQFNSVANCVIATCLGDRSLKPQQRAKVVERWIEVARVGQLAVPLASRPGPRAEVLQCVSPSRSLGFL